MMPPRHVKATLIVEKLCEQLKYGNELYVEGLLIEPSNVK